MMETNELRNIWKTLADKKLIGRELAEENIERIISTQSGNIIKKLDKKTRCNGIIYAVAFLFTLIATIYVQIDINKLFPTNTYIGIIAIEAFLLLNILREFSKSAFIHRSYKTDTIKDSLTKIRMYLIRVLRIDFFVGLTFSFSMLVIYLSKYLIDIGGFGNIKFSGNDLAVHSPYFVITIILVLLASPWWLKKELKMKFSKIQNDIDNSLKELENL
jgi:hypothetical protein